MAALESEEEDKSDEEEAQDLSTPFIANERTPELCTLDDLLESAGLTTVDRDLDDPVENGICWKFGGTASEPVNVSKGQKTTPKANVKSNFVTHCRPSYPLYQLNFGKCGPMNQPDMVWQRQWRKAKDSKRFQCKN